MVLATAIITAAWTINNGGMGTYFGLIVIWAGPFLLLLWLVLCAIAKNHRVDLKQEPFVSITGSIAMDEYHLADCTSNRVLVDC